MSVSGMGCALRSGQYDNQAWAMQLQRLLRLLVGNSMQGGAGKLPAWLSAQLYLRRIAAHAVDSVPFICACTAGSFLGIDVLFYFSSCHLQFGC
jgi:hypothetical protein